MRTKKKAKVQVALWMKSARIRRATRARRKLKLGATRTVVHRTRVMLRTGNCRTVSEVLVAASTGRKAIAEQLKVHR